MNHYQGLLATSTYQALHRTSQNIDTLNSVQMSRIAGKLTYQLRTPAKKFLWLQWPGHLILVLFRIINVVRYGLFSVAVIDVVRRIHFDIIQVFFDCWLSVSFLALSCLLFSLIEAISSASCTFCFLLKAQSANTLNMPCDLRIRRCLSVKLE